MTRNAAKRVNMLKQRNAKIKEVEQKLWSYKPKGKRK